jgi:hypothetical protein
MDKEYQTKYITIIIAIKFKEKILTRDKGCAGIDKIKNENIRNNLNIYIYFFHKWKN